jgi:hypothetical protein
MLAIESSQTSSQHPHARLGLSRAALRHLALLLLLTPLLGGLHILIDHADQRTVNEPIVVREVVEVPRTEYVRIEVPVPTIIIVEVPAKATPTPDQPPISNTPISPQTDNVPVAATASAPAVPEEVVAEREGDSEAMDGLQADPPTVVANVPVRSTQPGPSTRAIEPQTADDQLPLEPLAETPGETEVVAEEIAPAAPLSPAQHALANFYSYTDQNWSVQGYSSADEMRDVLGNGTTGWLNETSREASAAIDSADAVAAIEIPTRDQSESSSESIADVQPVTDSVPESDGFYTYTEENWSALGYSSPEDMRQSLTAN